MNLELVKLAEVVSWSFIETKCGEVYSAGPGMPPLPTRLLVGLAMLKHIFDLCDEDCVDAGSRTPISNISAAKNSSATCCPAIAGR